MKDDIECPLKFISGTINGIIVSKKNAAYIM